MSAKTSGENSAQRSTSRRDVIPAGIARAARALEGAADELRRQTALAYPLSTIVIARSGRAFVRGEVIGYDRTGYIPDAATVTIRHLATGKESTFNATDYGVEIESLGRPA